MIHNIPECFNAKELNDCLSTLTSKLGLVHLCVLTYHSQPKKCNSLQLFCKNVCIECLVMSPREAQGCAFVYQQQFNRETVKEKTRKMLQVVISKTSPDLH